MEHSPEKSEIIKCRNVYQDNFFLIILIPVERTINLHWDFFFNFSSLLSHTILIIQYTLFQFFITDLTQRISKFIHFYINFTLDLKTPALYIIYHRFKASFLGW